MRYRRTPGVEVSSGSVHVVLLIPGTVRLVIRLWQGLLEFPQPRLLHEGVNCSERTNLDALHSIEEPEPEEIGLQET